MCQPFAYSSPTLRQTDGTDRCTGTADYTPSQTAPNPLNDKAMTRRSLTNSSKSKPFGFHFQHGPTTLAQISIHHSYLAHVLIFLIHSSIFKQTHYSSRVMVTLPSLDFYRNLSMAKQINSRSLSIHTLTSISCSRAIRETCRVGSTQIT